MKNMPLSSRIISVRNYEFYAVTYGQFCCSVYGYGTWITSKNVERSMAVEVSFLGKDTKYIMHREEK